MKKLIIVFLLLPGLLAAQKEIKPSVSKAESAWQKGKFDEAKAIIDATVGNQEYMVDKKGNPSKNAAKAWYLHALIYASIDTTTRDAKIKALQEPDAFNKVKDGFAKAEELDKGKNKSLVDRLDTSVPGLTAALPVNKDDVAKRLANGYYIKGYRIFETKDYKKAFTEFNKVLYFVPTDTAYLSPIGIFFAPAAEESDRAIEIITKYHELKGTNPNSWIQLFSIYSKRSNEIRAKYKGSKNPDDVLKDPEFIKNTELALSAAKELTSRYPTNSEYLNLEYNIYATTNRLAEAKALMEKRAESDPTDRESRYFIALICLKLKDEACGRHWLEETLKVDPQYMDAALELANFSYVDAMKVKNERNETKDTNKRLELFKLIQKKLLESIPYWERCIAIDPKSQSAYDGLRNVYSDLASYDESYETKRTELVKKMKSLGLEVD